MPAAPDPRYPIGHFEVPGSITTAHRDGWVGRIAAQPERLRRAVAGLTNAQLDTPYRDGGWTVRQVVHHVADSHLNAYTRLRLALTEDAPTIKPYDEARWAALEDARHMPPGPSLSLLDGLHARWTALLETLGEAEWARTFVHPALGRAMALDEAAGMYAWHGDHHAAHIESLRERKGW